MATTDKSDQELWNGLGSLDDDLLDLDLPDEVVDDELRAIGVDPTALAERGVQFVAKVREEERLSWQAQARARRAALETRASKAIGRVPADMDRVGILARLDELRAADSRVGAAIKMAARKRKPEQSTDDELRTLLEEMEALRAIESDEPE